VHDFHQSGPGNAIDLVAWLARDLLEEVRASRRIMRRGVEDASF
jgi:hypothetical protein